MFTDSRCDSIEIKSSWKRDRKTNECGTQTVQVVNDEKGVQHISSASHETQTSGNSDSHANRPLKTFDSTELSKFVTKASKIAIKEIEKSKRNDIFDRIESFYYDERAKVSIVHNFSSEYLSALQTNPNIQYNVSSLSWNSNASILGVSYAVKDHNDWCTHDSYVLLWHLFKASNKSQEPMAILETDSCVTILRAHPSQPSIYCTASLNGKISLWNTRNKETEMLFASVIAHQSCVTGLHWISSNKKNDYGLLISCGLDGRIICWKIQENNKSLLAEDVFIVLAQDMPRTIQIKGDKSGSEVGIVNMSFNSDDPSIFIIGCHGGAIFQCSLKSTKPALKQTDPMVTNKIKSSDVKSPIVMSYAAHRGHINAVQCSPLSRNIFLSCGVDSELRIYNILQTTPLIVIHTDYPIISAEWSPSRPTIAGVGEDGKIYIYSIVDTKVSRPSFAFFTGENIFAKNLIYNGIENNEQIAVSSTNGDIHVCDLSMCSQQFDRKDLNDIFKKISSDQS